MLRLRPFCTPNTKTIITWTSEPEEIYKWSAEIEEYLIAGIKWIDIEMVIHNEQ